MVVAVQGRRECRVGGITVWMELGGRDGEKVSIGRDCVGVRGRL